MAWGVTTRSTRAGRATPQGAARGLEPTETETAMATGALQVQDMVSCRVASCRVASTCLMLRDEGVVSASVWCLSGVCGIRPISV
jgi:predicted RNA-binding Zn ribbon-like protein